MPLHSCPLKKENLQPPIKLIPWDPKSPTHVQRLIGQRIACGWAKEYVENPWREFQRLGHKSIYWIVLNDTTSLLTQHLTAYPTETTPLTDTALSLGGKPRIPSSTIFIPIGHISLDSDATDPPGHLSYDLLNTYRISTFYISSALQNAGLGRHALDIVEGMAVREPLCARTLALHTMADDTGNKEEIYGTWGVSVPKYSIVLWYMRRGYEPYKHVPNALYQADSEGKKWPLNWVYLKKDVR